MSLLRFIRAEGVREGSMMDAGCHTMRMMRMIDVSFISSRYYEAAGGIVREDGADAD